MKRGLALLTTALILTVSLIAAPVKDVSPFTPIDLKAHINVKHKDNLHSERYPNNNLATLPTGKQKWADVEFFVGDGVMQLGSATVEAKPEKIEGIKVDRTFQKLHIVQACGYSVPEEMVIGKYVLTYDDKSQVEINIVYGQDVVDWWAYPGQKDPTKSKLVWEGENEASKGFEAKIKLFMTTWENPHPKKKVVEIAFVATAMDTGVAPFCVAITAEEK